MDCQLRLYRPYLGPFDPCPPMRMKAYVVPPNQVIGFQPAAQPQYAPAEALRLGTLWPMLYSPYAPVNRERGEEA